MSKLGGNDQSEQTHSVERSLIDVLSQAYEFPTVAAMQASTVIFPVGKLLEWVDYHAGLKGGGNSGIVTTGAHTDDGGSIFTLADGKFVKANTSGVINAKWFGLKGNFTFNDKPQLVKLWDFAPWGSTIFYPEGHYKIDGGHTHPLKQLYHEGIGRSPTDVPSAINIKGTSFVFPTFAGVNKGGFYMPPPSGSNFSRFSSFRKMTMFGDGTNDDNGTITCLKINNLGTHLSEFDTRYSSVGIENNFSVGAKWSDIKLFAATFGVQHVYDVATPFGTELNSVATENLYENIQVATSSTNANAIGWFVDATCAYANNHHGGSFDCEQCFTGMTIEGRISAKDHDSIQVFGAASFQSVGNVFDSLWFEANTGDNFVLSFDPGQPEPALTIRNLFQDVKKETTAADTQNTLTTPTGDRPLILGTTKDAPQGVSGGWGSPFTGGQFLLHGKEINAPLTRNLISERIGKNLSNRATITQKAGYEWSHEKNTVPLVGATVNLANLEIFSNTNRSVILDYTISATGNSGTHFAVTGKILIKNDSDAITFANIPATEQFLPAGTKPITIQPIRVATDTFGLFLFKDASVTEVVHATISLKYIVGAGGAADRQSILTTFSV